MQYYKVIKNNKVIDVLDHLTYMKWQPKHKIMVLCTEDDAQAILSSDKNTIWHEETLYKIPVEGYETVSLEQIDEFEYKQLRMFSMKSIEQVIDEYTKLLVEMEVI